MLRVTVPEDGEPKAGSFRVNVASRVPVAVSFAVVGCVPV
jgi:hypothetical protein